jgi:CheY-like chemotaxis protein
VATPCQILLVEDNPADAHLVVLCLQDSEHAFHVRVAASGDGALAILRGEGAHAGEPRPDLILLDWNLPGLAGGEVLDAVKSNPDWRTIPVVVLTSSQSASDVRDALDRRADGFISKPIELSGYDRIARSIEAYWLPRRQSAGG